MAKLAKAMVSNTIARKRLWVRIPPAALDRLTAMTRAPGEVERVLALVAQGANSCQISRLTGAPAKHDREVAAWSPSAAMRSEDPTPGAAACIRCSGYRLHPFPRFTEYSYAYLFGLYLGDGCLLRTGRAGVYRFNLSLDAKYPVIRDEAQAALAIVMPSSKASIRRHRHQQLVWVDSASKHWPCLLPQHGPGVKHRRLIELDDWQRAILDQHPVAIPARTHPLRRIATPEHDQAPEEDLSLSAL